MADEHVICLQCGDVIEEEDDSYTVQGNDTVCLACLEKYYIYCDECEEYFPLDDCVEARNKTICSSCFERNFVTCRFCEDIIHSSDSERFHGDDFCPSCFEAHFSCCDSCGEYSYSEDLNYHESSGELYCSYCSPEENSDSIHGASYLPPLEFHGKDKNNLFFGIELEVEAPYSIDLCRRASNLIEDLSAEIKNLAFCKEDGSLCHGFEIVTHPFSFNWYRDHPDFFDKVFNLSKEGIRSWNTDTCGMHIHMSRTAFSQLAIYKLLSFFHSNPGFIYKISGRVKENLERWSKVYSLASTGSPSSGGGDKYRAIRLNKSETIEIRIFRGTLCKSSFFKNLEFCHAVFMWLKQVSVKEVNSPKAVDLFLAYIAKNKDLYENLSKWLLEKSRFSEKEVKIYFNRKKEYKQKSFNCEWRDFNETLEQHKCNDTW